MAPPTAGGESKTMTLAVVLATEFVEEAKSGAPLEGGTGAASGLAEMVLPGRRMVIFAENGMAAIVAALQVDR